VNRDEQIVEKYLKSLQIGDVLFEPDGNVPPDFSIDHRIAVEVRRLNQHYEANGELRGLEQDAIPIQQGLEKLLQDFSDPPRAGTWFVLFEFRRPIPAWKELKSRIREALSSFLGAPADGMSRLTITDSFWLTLIRSTSVGDRCFLFGGCTDFDAGGWIVSEVVRNASAFMAIKSTKVTQYLKNYSEWWLILVDYIALGGEQADVLQYLSRPDPWDRVIVLSPSRERAYDL
jgi:hypothetical protein